MLLNNPKQAVDIICRSHSPAACFTFDRFLKQSGTKKGYVILHICFWLFLIKFFHVLVAEDVYKVLDQCDTLDPHSYSSSFNIFSLSSSTLRFLSCRSSSPPKKSVAVVPRELLNDHIAIRGVDGYSCLMLDTETHWHPTSTVTKPP